MDSALFAMLLRSVNIAALLGGMWALLKIVIPAALSVRDSLRDTASELRSIREMSEDHENRIRNLEAGVSGDERRFRPERRDHEPDHRRQG